MTESVVFDRAAGFYDATRGFPPGEDLHVGQFLRDAAELSATDTVLEIGVGTGRIALPLAAHVGRYVGVDLSVPMMDRLREKQPSYPPGTIHLVQGDATKLPLVSNGFEVGVVVHVFHLVSDLIATVNELARVVKPGGKVLQCWNSRDENAFEPLKTAWQQAAEREIVPDQWQRAFTVLADMGWQPEGEPQAYHWTETQTPQDFFERYRGRMWSRMWQMSDEAWQAGVDAVEAALTAHYPDPHQPLDVPSSFNVQVFSPPKG